MRSIKILSGSRSILLTVLILVLSGSACGAANHSTSADQSTAGGQSAAANPEVPAPEPYYGKANATVFVPEGQVAKVFSEPFLDSAVKTSLDNGYTIYVDCTAQGDTVTNYRGERSSLWDHTYLGYIPDVNLDTGTTEPIAPSCR